MKYSHVRVTDGLHDGIYEVIGEQQNGYCELRLGPNETLALPKDECVAPLVWICGRFNSTWEFLGVYTMKAKAVARCRLYEDFIAPMVLDVDSPEAPVEMENVEYPLAGRPV